MKNTFVKHLKKVNVSTFLCLLFPLNRPIRKLYVFTKNLINSRLCDWSSKFRLSFRKHLVCHSFAYRMLKKKETGASKLTLGNFEKPLIHFDSPHPRKPLNCLKKLSPSLKTIEVFGKPPPVPFPCDRGGDREGDPFIQCPLPSSLYANITKNFGFFIEINSKLFLNFG